MKRILFVVHRYYPFPGGSEYNVQNMAEECVRRGHETWVLSDEHQGDQNGVRVTSDRKIIQEKWSLVVVHGSCPTQDFVLANITNIASPVLYLLIQPSHSSISQWGMSKARWVGCGTSFDVQHANKYGVGSRIFPFVYGIPPVLGNPGFRDLFGITTKQMYLSVGGFWPHKRMSQLRDVFVKANIPDTTLVLLGYDNRHNTIPHSAENVKVIFGTTHQHILDGMAEADLLISNSSSEGYGLVLLEAMYNGCSWLATDIAAAHDLSWYGTCFNTEDELDYSMKHFTEDPVKLNNAFQYVRENQMISHCIDGLETIME